ncbi:MAG: hypothetical protein JPMHGGIA_01832 [Saprospiraceae bacterium]|nr:hypothetical protein [Saprospiraceae bacterium]
MPENPYILKFTLKQHTPIIHFQHDQEGATLRATEVKPKLDLFIMKKCLTSKNITWEHDQDARDKFKQAALHPGNDNDKKPWKNWLMGKGKSINIALDYKIEIQSTLDKYVLFSAMPLNLNKKDSIKYNADAIKYFGNNFELVDDCQYFADSEFIKFQQHTNNINPHRTYWNNLRPGLMFNSIQCSIRSTSKSLRERIKLILPYFFANTNFGTRQSKGFGSFTTPNFNASTHLNFGACLYQKECAGDYKQQLKEISKDWKFLKAGFNHGHIYYKSDLMKYYCMLNGTRWEKRNIKKEIHSRYPNLYLNLKKRATINRIAGCCGDVDTPSSVTLNANTYYIRGLLGLTEHFEFAQNHGDPVKIKVSNDEIHRFKAPITFKIVDNYIYMIVQPVSQLLSSGGTRMFNFELSPSILSCLAVPANFNICHFLNSPWLGDNFELVSNWGDYNLTGITKNLTVAEHLGYTQK